MLPHAAVLPHVSAVVTHGGHGTLTVALADGLPIVAIPNDAADQPALAAQTARLGAGLHLTDDASSPAAVAAAVRTVLDDPRYAAQARALAERVQSCREAPLVAVSRLFGQPAT